METRARAERLLRLVEIHQAESMPVELLSAHPDIAARYAELQQRQRSPRETAAIGKANRHVIESR